MRTAGRSRATNSHIQHAASIFEQLQLIQLKGRNILAIYLSSGAGRAQKEVRSWRVGSPLCLACFLALLTNGQSLAQNGRVGEISSSLTAINALGPAALALPWGTQTRGGLGHRAQTPCRRFTAYSWRLRGIDLPYRDGIPSLRFDRGYTNSKLAITSIQDVKRTVLNSGWAGC